ncbi:MAG: hypothetical protein ACLFWF_08070 [Alphaproteobacteria bacterium]
MGKPVKIERLDRERFGNLPPWSIAAGHDFDKSCMAQCVPEGPACWKLCAREPVFDADDADNEDMPAEDEDIIVFSNSCGFMRTTYEHVHLADPKSEPLQFVKRKGFSVYVTIGEWCRLGNKVRDAGEGLLLGKWGETFYEIANFIVFEGSQDGYFLSLSQFDKHGLEQVRPLLAPIEEEQQVCFDSDNLRPRKLAEITSHGMFRRRQHPYDLCETHGLPISDAVTVYRKLGTL